MSQLDFAQGVLFRSPRESAIVSTLFIYGIMDILVTCNIATSPSLPRCRDGVRSYSSVTFCLVVSVGIGKSSTDQPPRPACNGMSTGDRRLKRDIR